MIKFNVGKVEMELGHKPQEIINNRYRIINILGQGGMGTTYKVLDLMTSTEVVIKLVSLRQAGDWKVLELFEREAKILAGLNYPFIPKYLDYFELDTEQDKYFYLVQELVPGASLSQLVEQNWQYNETTVIEIAKKILEILEYLHSLTPPIIHRDIKPENIIIKEDKSIYLVDFGSVQSVYRNPHSFSNTFVGTLGYIPPEQFSGKVAPASDLYSLGCTLLFLLTKRLPSELPINRLKIDFRDKVLVSKEFANWLDKILEPIIEDRFQSAKDALKSLPNYLNTPFISQTKEQKTLENKLFTEKSKYSKYPKYSKCYLSTNKLEENKFYIWEKDDTLFIDCLDVNSFCPKSLKIEGKIFILSLEYLGISYKVQGQSTNLAVSNIKKEFGDCHQNIYCTIYDGTNYYNFGTNLSREQREQVVKKISDFIEKKRRR